MREAGGVRRVVFGNESTTMLPKTYRDGMPRALVSPWLNEFSLAFCLGLQEFEGSKSKKITAGFQVPEGS
jgi:hypothetical protein